MATPIEAAQSFAERGRVTSFEVPAHAVWRASAPDAQTDGVTVISGDVALHALQLPDRTWAIDSGERCG
jgi:hypothetical protein